MFINIYECLVLILNNELHSITFNDSSYKGLGRNIGIGYSNNSLNISKLSVAFTCLM